MPRIFIGFSEIEPVKLRGFGFKKMKKNLIGLTFSRLTIIKEVQPHIFPCGKKWKKVLCKCECGNKIKVLYYNLTSGHTKSCGCFHIEKIKEKNTFHGMEGTRFYKIWQGIKQRCLNKNNKNYKNYGGRGIMVCKQWLKLENFRDDMYLSYKEHCDKYSVENTSIERIKNNGNYNKGNCRWATRKEQNNNSRNNHLLNYKGQIFTMAQLANKLNMEYYLLQYYVKTNKSFY